MNFSPSIMSDAIKKIRELLDELEARNLEQPESFKESFQLFELPQLVGDIVDYLQPALLPYEAAIYWHLFRHSIIATGDVFARASVRGLARRVVSSFRSAQASALSYSAVQDALQGLQSKGVISLAGDTNREGTLYRIHLPEEIALCRDAMSKAQEKQLPKIDPKRELDFYNVKENRLKIFERDKYICQYPGCGKQLTRFSATLDHLTPVSKGGDNSYENLVTACLQHNSQRGAQTLMDFLARKHEGKSSAS
jgi:5-methylcytosine-specific restriction endonuclease McrA